MVLMIEQFQKEGGGASAREALVFLPHPYALTILAFGKQKGNCLLQIRYCPKTH
jgi:hypothetical protein